MSIFNKVYFVLFFARIDNEWIVNIKYKMMEYIIKIKDIVSSKKLV